MRRAAVGVLLWLTLALAPFASAACSSLPPEEAEASQLTPTATPQPTRPQVAGEPGELLWRHEIGGAVWSAPTVVDGVVYFGSEDNHVYALDAETGALLWRFLTDGSINESPAVKDGVVYVAASFTEWQTGNTPVYALDAATGNLRWRARVSGHLKSPWWWVAAWSTSDHSTATCTP